MQPYLIKAKELSVTKQGKSILDNVSLTITEKDFITIIGPNGAGKSILLKCLMGFYQPDNGVVNRKKNLKIGYIPQRFTPDQTIPIYVNKFIKLSKQSNKIEEIIEQTKISHLLKKQVFSLSGGELQRVLLARSLIGNPDILVLDEPAQNLDISGQLSFYKLLKRIYNEKNISILMVSHDLHMVMASTKQVICLFKHICCSGEPNIVTQDPEFISMFGKDMAKMMAIYHHEHSHTH